MKGMARTRADSRADWRLWKASRASWGRVAGKVSKRGSDGGVVGYEATVEVGEAEEGAGRGNVMGQGPVGDSCMGSFVRLIEHGAVGFL